MSFISEKLNKKPPRKGLQKFKFLALQDEITDALNNGHSAKAIWELLIEEQRIQVTYPQFTRYSARCLKKVCIKIV